MPFCGLCLIKIKITRLCRQFPKGMPVTGNRLDDRVIHHLLTIVIEIVIHADLQEGQQAKADFSNKLPALLINDFFDLFQIILEGILVFQLECRQINPVVLVEQIIQSRIDLNLIIVLAESVWSIQGFQAQLNRHHQQRRFKPG